MSEERKLVTILFADVTGSTELGDALDPEDVRILMGSYYAHARRVIAHHGGTIEKFIGDAVMAVFGLPHAHGDDAERALAAALALREAVAQDEVLGGAFQLRMGINTGEVVATSDPASTDFLITGDVVNVAARLQQSAGPGEIVAGERTAGAAGTAFVFEQPRLVEVKGKRQPVRVFPLKGSRTVRKVERPPLVGRKADLLQLSLLQARALEERQPQIVSIIASAGTGKTRLLEEFLKRLEPDDGFRVATVRCQPYGQTLTYWPLRGLLIGLLSEDIAKAQVTNVFTRGGYAASDAARLADLVLTTLGIEGEETGDRESIFAAWRLLIEVLAQQVPSILIFEDLHWASESMLDLVEYLTHVRTQAPLLVIILSRPELLDRRPHWGGGRQNFTALALQPLTTAQTEELVQRLAGDLPPATRAQIVAHSGGNPFFVLEMIRGLAERGLAGETTAPHGLPDTVHAAVLARLDLLSKKEREVLQVASVASRTFRPAMLAAILSDYSMQEIDAALDGLLSRDMIAALEGGAFTFRHILIREVAYGTLARGDRIRLHSSIAAWLEDAAAEHLDEYTEVIAYHYREAVRLARQSAVPKAMSAETERAVQFLKRAAELASRAGAFAEARDYLQNAIEIAPEPEHVQLYEQLGDSVAWGSTAVDAYNSAVECWRKTEAHDVLLGARLMRKLLICITRGFGGKKLEKEEFIALRTEAQQLAEVAGEEGEVWRIRVVDLFCTPYEKDVIREDVDGLKHTGLAAAAYFEQLGDWAAFSEALDGYAELSMRIGAFDDALRALKRRLTAPELPALERGDALQMIAKAYMSKGDYDSCIATIQEALVHMTPGEPLVYLGSGVSHAISAAFWSGRWQVVDTLMDTLEKIREQAQYDPKTIFVVDDGYLAVLQVALAREDRATIDAAACVLTRLFPDGTFQAHTLLSALLEDDPQKIDFHFDHIGGGVALNILTFYNEHAMAVPEVLVTKLSTEYRKMDAFIRCCDIAHALASGDDARLVQTIEDAEAHHLVVHAARMRIVLAQRTGDRAQMARARAVLERVGDCQYLRKLVEVEAMLKSVNKM